MASWSHRLQRESERGPLKYRAFISLSKAVLGRITPPGCRAGQSRKGIWETNRKTETKDLAKESWKLKRALRTPCSVTLGPSSLGPKRMVYVMSPYCGGLPGPLSLECLEFSQLPIHLCTPHDSDWMPVVKECQSAGLRSVRMKTLPSASVLMNHGCF